MPIIGKTRPEKPSVITPLQLKIFRLSSLVFIITGCFYITWRWIESFNPDHIEYCYIVWITECIFFLGSVLRIINYWHASDVEKQQAVHMLSEIRQLQPNEHDRPVTIDIYIATINEEEFILHETITEAKRLFYPYPDVSIKVYLLDDGQRDGRDHTKENFKSLAEKLDVYYVSRKNNIGFKAGNLNNAILQSCGDLFVILDADTRPFPRFLYHTTGYFRNHKVAWVQTPQWFKDITESENLKEHLKTIAGKSGLFIGNILERFYKKTTAGKDIFCSNPNVFYDVVLRRRNKHNAVFSCGAGSIMRREAVLSLMNENSNIELGIPYRHHISEDIFNSLLMHADVKNKWQSVYHAAVECSMLSPQDLTSWIKQQKRYAMGSIDIGLSKFNPLFLKGLTFMQRISYFTVFYSYITPLFSIILFAVPIIYFFTQTAPFIVSVKFIIFFILFQLLNIIVFKSGHGSISTKRFDQKFWASFSYIISSWLTVIQTRKLPFHVTPKKRVLDGKHWKHIIPHILIITCTILGIIYNSIHLFISSNVYWLPTILFTVLGIYHIYQLNTFVRAAFWKPDSI